MSNKPPLRREEGTEFEEEDQDKEDAELLEDQEEGLEDGEGVGSARCRGRGSVGERFTLYSPEEERKVLKRLDWRLVAFMALLYMMSFLDRSNIGNARIAGLESDLQLTSSQYDWLLTAFYATYIMFEWMVLLYRLIPAHIHISLCILSWGVIASLQSVVTSYRILLVLRALLGIGEAAFGPGLPFYLSFFFRRDELAYRTGLFISAAPLATSFASSLAWLITKFSEGGPIAPWRLLFLVEGFPSVLVAAFAWGYIPDSPETARFLTKRERKVAALRMQDERETEAEVEAEAAMSEKMGIGRRQSRLSLPEIRRTLVDPKSYLTALMFFNCNVAFSSLPVFLPTIINDMGHSPVTSQLLSAFPSLLAFPILLISAHLSDRSASRSPYLVFTSLLGFLGYTILALSSPSVLALPSWLRYVAIFPATAGFFSSITLIISWNLNNQASATGKGAGLALLNIVGQCGPLLGTRLYPKKDAPYYTTGMTVCASCMAAVAILALGLRLVLRIQNEKRKKTSPYDGDGKAEFLYIL
ncbi:MFS general substrate transporter [Eremomyces bilateralis CBS 781.70]|uniref:MFS general substrate transporter n=1 Tax=Eremomyces bilateralis CBS 781.70 TaxID=1392243 RepID=A0A6G1GH14_9PEZI|nr:MFS general substrate transporter [Eremomyces bilateralis CBS 781.70]KAF1817397.1 MFS general substrate transporter [Eremomyces bilateralis CBS 781.70]